MTTDTEMYISIAYTLLETIIAENNSVRLRLLRNGSAILTTIVANDAAAYIASGVWGLACDYSTDGGLAGHRFDNYAGGDSVTNLFTDSFTRADNNTLGANWTELQESPAVCFHILSNTLNLDNNIGLWGSAPVNIGFAIPTVATSTSAQHSEIQNANATFLDNAAPYQLLIRGTGSSVATYKGYLGAVPPSLIGSSYSIAYLDVANNIVQTLVSGTGIAVTNGDIFRLEAIEGIWL